MTKYKISNILSKKQSSKTIVKKCCATHCQGNYTKINKEKFLEKFEIKDLKQRNLWLSFISRDNIPDDKDSRVQFNFQK